MTEHLQELAAAFAAPPAASRPWAFWFLNDDTPVPDLLEQLDAFASAGFGTVCPCARVGLAESIGYLTPAWWELIRAVVARCADLGLRVVLYDEASYPSGAANGLVVAEDPEFASRCLRRAVVTVDLDPGRIRYARPSLGRSLWDRRVATVVVTASGQRRLIDPEEGGLVRLDAAELGPGPTRVEAYFDSPSGGTIRGAHAWQDDGSALAPASADLLNPDAVAAFCRLTHDAYLRELGPWFGTTVVAMFTDEPAPLGRGHHEDGVAWTPGLEADLAREAGVPVGDVLLNLSGVFEVGSHWAAVHEAAVAARVSRVYHGAQRAWCDAHGLALTGHPERPDEMAALDAFTWPGQDTVWRWVLPGPSALTGPESAGPRAAASAAVLRRLADPGTRVPVVNEVYGAYGWALDFDEMKWLADWLAVRGTTAFLLHALFASVRGNRAYESEPDLGLANAWWPKLPVFLTYLARTTLVGEALAEDPRVAVAVTGDRVPADAVAPLHTHGIGFVYAPLADLRAAGAPAFEAVVCLPADADVVRAALPGARLVVADAEGWWEALDTDAPRVLGGESSDLRVRAGTLGGVRASLVTNEGEEPVTVEATGAVWDPWTGRIHHAPGSWTLPRRASAWLTDVAPTGPAPEPVRGEASGTVGVEVALAPWDADHALVTGLGDWTSARDLERFAGTVTYTTVFHLGAPGPLELDMGTVGDAASVRVNGSPVAELYWAPHRCVIASDAVHPGRNTLAVEVTNSSANRFEGALRPSGLLGPVSLRRLPDGAPW